VRFRRVLQLAEPAGAELTGEVARLAARIGLARSPSVRLTRRRVPPLVWGLVGRPTMLLPVELVQSLSDEARETLLVHELAHLTRRATCARWLELAAIGLYWWHPVAWWARRNVEEAEEQCCDARVVAMLPHAARAYAETLLATVEFLAEPGGAVPWGARAFAEIGPIQRRLTMILDERASKRMTWPARTMLAIVALAVLPMSISALWADPAKTPETAVATAEEPQPAAGVAEAQPAAGAVEAVAAEAAPAEKPAAAPAEKPAENSVEARLERLERLLERLAPEKVVSTPGPDAKPASEAKPAGESKSPSLVKELQERPKQYYPAVLDTRSLGELEREMGQTLERAKREMERRVQYIQKHFDQLSASQRQVEATLKAYDTGTIAVDQVLEGIRRRAGAQVQYAVVAAESSPSQGTREYLRALGNVVAAEQARRDTKKLWSELADRGAPREVIARAAAQYDLFELQVKRWNESIGPLQKYRVYPSHALVSGELDVERRRLIRYAETVAAVQASAVEKIATAAEVEAARAKQRQRDEELFAARAKLQASEESAKRLKEEVERLAHEVDRIKKEGVTGKETDTKLEAIHNRQRVVSTKLADADHDHTLAQHQIRVLLELQAAASTAKTGKVEVGQDDRRHGAVQTAVAQTSEQSAEFQRIKRRLAEERLIDALSAANSAEKAMRDAKAQFEALEREYQSVKAQATPDSTNDVTIADLNNRLIQVRRKYNDAVRDRSQAKVAVRELSNQLTPNPTRRAAVAVKEPQEESATQANSRLLDEEIEHCVTSKRRIDDLIRQRTQEAQQLVRQITDKELAVADAKTHAASGDLASQRPVWRELQSSLDELQKKRREVERELADLNRQREQVEATLKDLVAQIHAPLDPEAAPVEEPAVQPAPAPAGAKQSQSRRQSRERVLATTVGLADKLSDPALDECQRDGVYAMALRTVADDALVDARDVWRQVHVSRHQSGGTQEAAREAQAREQYFRFKAQAQVAASQAAWFGY